MGRLGVVVGFLASVQAVGRCWVYFSGRAVRHWAVLAVTAVRAHLVPTEIQGFRPLSAVVVIVVVVDRAPTENQGFRPLSAVVVIVVVVGQVPTETQGFLWVAVLVLVLAVAVIAAAAAADLVSTESPG
jgi:hypothetical protein